MVPSASTAGGSVNSSRFRARHPSWSPWADKLRFAFDEQQAALKASARRFLEREWSSRRIRGCMTTDQGYDPEIWGRISGELGWTALTIPAEYGGAGCSVIWLA